MDFSILIIVISTSIGILILFALYQIFIANSIRLYAEARKLISQLNYDQAVKVLYKLINSFPNHKEGRILLADTLYKIERYEEGLKHYIFLFNSERLPETVDIKDILLRIVEGYKKLNRYDSIYDYITKLIDLDPENYQYYYDRAIAYYYLKNYSRAIEDLNKFLSKVKKFPEAYLYRARSYYNMDNLEKSKSDFLEYLGTNKETTIVLEFIGLLEKLRDTENLKKWYEYLLEHLKGNRVLEVAKKLAAIREEEEEYEEAIRILEQFKGRAETDKSKCDILYKIGGLYKKIQKDEMAVEYYKQVYQIDKTYRNVKNILKRQFDVLSDEDLIELLFQFDTDKFEDFSRYVARHLHLEIQDLEVVNPEEIYMECLMPEEMKKTLVLVKNVRWRQKTGEHILKEFNLKVLDRQAIKGIFISPEGFTDFAYAYAKRVSMKLIEAEKLAKIIRNFKFNESIQ